MPLQQTLKSQRHSVSPISHHCEHFWECVPCGYLCIWLHLTHGLKNKTRGCLCIWHAASKNRQKKKPCGCLCIWHMASKTPCPRQRGLMWLVRDSWPIYINMNICILVPIYMQYKCTYKSYKYIQLHVRYIYILYKYIHVLYTCICNIMAHDLFVPTYILYITMMSSIYTYYTSIYMYYTRVYATSWHMTYLYLHTYYI